MTRRSDSDSGSGAQPNISDSAPKRVFGWSDMFVHSDDDPRSGGTFADERTVLVEFLRNQRLTLERKCDSLDAEQLARRSVPPSTMSLLGLIRHMAEVERGWFRRTMAGQDAPPIYCSEDEPDGDFDGAVADPAVVDAARRAWRAEVEFAERFVAEAADLKVWGRQRRGNVIVLRELLVHMIEEYARHNGHADLLRERIDGRVGQ
ncbi:DinB family protein [Micromonospora sp. NPDC005298]|uniref:DinB family protein n=1 Tax=Micromonospora sp. NPDC005298 TaxID=3156873 RepID=UPI0033B61304